MLTHFDQGLGTWNSTRRVFDYVYDDLGRLTGEASVTAIAIKDPNSADSATFTTGTTTYLTSYQYDLRGNRVQKMARTSFADENAYTTALATFLATEGADLGTPGQYD